MLYTQVADTEIDLKQVDFFHGYLLTFNVVIMPLSHFEEGGAYCFAHFRRSVGMLVSWYVGLP